MKLGGGLKEDSDKIAWTPILLEVGKGLGRFLEWELAPLPIGGNWGLSLFWWIGGKLIGGSVVGLFTSNCFEGKF